MIRNWFRSGPSPQQTSLAMIGARAGDRVLFVGAEDPALAADVARVTGLNGRTVVVDRAPGAETRIERAAANAGALVEFEDARLDMLPIDTDAFDVVVIVIAVDRSPSIDRSAVIAEAVRVVTPGGRVIALTAAKRGGIFGAVSQATAAPPSVSTLQLLERAGAIAARRLADVDGVTYFEARKPKQ